MMRSFKTFFLFVFSGISVLGLYYFYEIHSSYYKGVRAYESYRHGMALAESISSYYYENKAYPKNMESLNFQRIENSHVGKVKFDGGGSFRIQLAGDSLDEGVLVFFLKTNNHEKIFYICQSLGVPTKYIPEECVRKDL